MRKQHFRLPPWQRKPTASETAPDIAASELVPPESAAQPTRHKHGKRTAVIGGVLLVVGSVLFGVAYQLAWYYIVGIAAVLAIVSVMIRVACKFGKWDQGDNHPGNGTPGDKE